MAVSPYRALMDLWKQPYKQCCGKRI